jgi:hypothetical protein
MKKEQKTVAFDQVLDLARALAKQEKTSIAEAVKLTGYSNGVMNGWKKKDRAPETAKWAILGRLNKEPDSLRLGGKSGLNKVDVDTMIHLIIEHGEPTERMLKLTAKLALM